MTPAQEMDSVIIANARRVAREHGYAIGVHGSQGPKDLDLIAVPWTEEAVEPIVLIDALLKGCQFLYKGEIIKDTPNKPHGRLAVILIQLSGENGTDGCTTPHRLIDLSITPRLLKN